MFLRQDRASAQMLKTILGKNVQDSTSKSPHPGSRKPARREYQVRGRQRGVLQMAFRLDYEKIKYVYEHGVIPPFRVQPGHPCVS